MLTYDPNSLATSDPRWLDAILYNDIDSLADLANSPSTKWNDEVLDRPLTKEELAGMRPGHKERILTAVLEKICKKDEFNLLVHYITDETS